MGRRIAAVAVVIGMTLGASAREVVVGIAETCPTNRRVEVCAAYATGVYAVGAIPFVLPATTNADDPRFVGLVREALSDLKEKSK